MRATTFKHSSRSYFDLYNALKLAYPTKQDWMFIEKSGQFDFQSEMMNNVARDIMEPFTREAAYGFASRCDYEPLEADGCTGSMTIVLNEAMEKTLPIGYKFGGISQSTGELVIFETTEEGDSGGTDTITVNVKQKETISGFSIGQVNSNAEFSDYPIDGYIGIIRNSVSAEISSQDWTRVENYDNSSPTSRHFMLLFQSNGKSRVRFGDGITGMKPTLNSEILLTFEVTKGQSGRMAENSIVLNIGADSDIQSVTNAAATSGGNDSESVASILRNARANVRLQGIIWSKEDLESAAGQASSSVVKALGIPGLGTAIVHIIPAGGGAPSSELKTAVQEYMQPLTQFGAMPLSMGDPNYIPVDIAATATIRDGFDGATVRNLLEFGLTMVTCAFDNEIMEYYDDNGIDACRADKINSIWSWAFTEDENDALEFIIQKWRELLGDRLFREWGQPLEVGDLWEMGNSLRDYGVDVFDLDDPTGNTTVTSLQIIDTGTCAVT